MTLNRLQFEWIGLAAEKPVHLEPAFHSIISRNTTRGIDMKHAKRTRDENGKYAQEDYIRIINCECCGRKFREKKKKKHFCSQLCYRSSKRYIDLQGYVCIKVPNHPQATTNGWIREHISVATNIIGRPLLRSECVHHIDGNRQNNNPENLTVMPLGVHIRKHNGNPNNRKYGEPNSKIKCNCGCNIEICKYDKKGRPRKYAIGHHRRK